MDEKLRVYLPTVEKPARYVGGEYNLPDFSRPYSIRFCLCFTDLYEVGMSNLGIQILYGALNDTEGVRCERCFAPWIDLGAILKEKGILLSSLETGTPLKDFDVIGMSVPYEMSYSNVPKPLKGIGITFITVGLMGMAFMIFMGIQL